MKRPIVNQPPEGEATPAAADAAREARAQTSASPTRVRPAANATISSPAPFTRVDSQRSAGQQP